MVWQPQLAFVLFIQQSQFHHGGIGAVAADILCWIGGDTKAHDGMHLDVWASSGPHRSQLVMVRLPGSKVLLGLKKRGIGEGCAKGRTPQTHSTPQVLQRLWGQVRAGRDHPPVRVSRGACKQCQACTIGTIHSCERRRASPRWTWTGAACCSSRWVSTRSRGRCTVRTGNKHHTRIACISV